MRKGLTLIELILSMVIIGIVFTVIPRLIMSMNQSTQTTIKEEAMFNAMAQMGAIINLPWDNNNTQNSQILNVNPPSAYDCNNTFSASGGPLGYRIGGFIGGRNCRALSNGSYDFNASAIVKEDTDYNDIDDYDTNVTTPKIQCSDGTLKSLDYNITTSVYYVSDPAVSGSSTLSNTPFAPTTNTKYIAVKKGSCTIFEYHSFNIGQIQINSRSW